MVDTTSVGETNENRFVSYAFRFLGAILLLLTVFPIYRIVASSDSGRIATDVVQAAETARSLTLLGTFIVLTLGVLASRFMDPARFDERVAGIGAWLTAVRMVWFAAALAVVATVITAIFSTAVLAGKPNLIDAMVQLTQARFVAAGHLSGPVDTLTDFWHLPNSIVTRNGWVSQYPPGYLVLLGLGMRIGIVTLVGPILVGVTVFFSGLAAERLFPDDRTVARIGAILLAFSPFVVGLAGAYMNHIGAAAFIAIAVYCALRSRDGRGFAWAVLSGAAVGAVFSIRPLTGVVAALVVGAIWIMAPTKEGGAVKALVLRVVGATIGILPFFIALGAYNQHFFGSPFRFGYSAAVGPLVAPGFHRDPAGHWYGPAQALGYTSSDLTTLGMYLLESPISVVFVVALFLMVARRFAPGTRILVIWALLPVVANALYWHHGIFMGPRMLNEWSAAWALLTAAAAIGLVRRIPAQKSFGNYFPRAGLTLAFALAWVAGVVYLAPQRLVRYGGSWMASSRLALPKTPTPSLVFVHGGWPTRIAVRLTSHGMRGDSVEAAMALNATCDVFDFANWYATRSGGDSPPVAVNFDFSKPTPTQRIDVAQGEQIRYNPAKPLTRPCQREVAADTLGVIDISPLVWQGDLPGAARGAAMIVRDLGPELNAQLIARYPERVPMMLIRTTKEGQPRLVPYEQGMKLLWAGG
ncbi:MAG TPA: hypothetical protein VJ825_05105 [Gemmatimonadaceae bacterium]|nr:hypothetical protein [Gemmatimonadaceae bacterium]